MVKEYLTAVVNQDWEKAGTMLYVPSLEKKLQETVSVIKMAPTMTDWCLPPERSAAQALPPYSISNQPPSTGVVDRERWNLRVQGPVVQCELSC